MNSLKEINKINENKVIKEILNFAITNLKKRFEILKINSALMRKEINNIKKDVLKINKESSKNKKINKLKSFLLSYCEIYVSREKTPLNLFSRDCEMIFKNNFIR